MAQQVEDVSGRCPYLGILRDPDSFYGFPANENACHKLIRPEMLDPNYQENVCFGDYTACPVFQHAELAPNLPEEARGHQSRRSTLGGALPSVGGDTPAGRRIFLIVGIIVAVFAIGIVIAGIIFVPQLLSTAEPTATTFVVVAEDTATPTSIPPTPTPTTPAPTATTAATRAATATLAVTSPPTATPTIDGVFGRETLEFDSYIREGPDTQFEEIVLVPAGTEVGILGRDLNGFWLLCELDDGLTGWIKTTQFVGDPPVAEYPLAEDIPPTYTPVPTTEG